MDEAVSQFVKVAARIALRDARKSANRARYERRFARHQPPKKAHHYPAVLMLTVSQHRACTLHGVPEYLQQVVRMTYGPKDTWGHGKFQNGTKKGPGRRPHWRG